MSFYYYNTKINDSYLIKRKEVKGVIKQIVKERLKLDYPITRSNKSYERELKAHNLMYKLHLFKKHTKDTDLEEHIKKWKEIVYFILGR